MTTHGKERPILFKLAMVRAILAGQKTQTRRIVKNQEDMEFDPNDPTYGPYWYNYACDADGEELKVRCPYGKPGDRLWVREKYMKAKCPITMTGAVQVTRGPAIDEKWQYCAWYEDSPDPGGLPIREGWKSPIFMPRWASRITLEITAVRVERIQSISGPDCWAEGIKYAAWPPECYGSTVECYRDLWQSIHGLESWEANPYVWVLDLQRITPLNESTPA
jgi:hypothetical protein